MKRRKLKRLSKHWAFTGEIDTKYLAWLPAISTIYNGHIWPIGFSLKFLWAGFSIVYVPDD